MSDERPMVNLSKDNPEDIRAALDKLRKATQNAPKVHDTPAPIDLPPRSDREEGDRGKAPSSPDTDVVLDAERRAEAVLFAAGEPLSAEALAEVLPPGVEPALILMRLQKTYAARGVSLVEVGGKWRFQTAPDLAYLFVEQREEQKKLSQAGLETLAIIAYCQPVTRAEIEEVRGVAVSKGTVDVLMEAGWVRLRGRRRTPGRPVTYGTTDAFLEHFGLESLDVLPGKSEFQAAGLLDSVIPPGFELPGPVTGGGDLDPVDAAEDGEDTRFHVDFMDERD